MKNFKILVLMWVAIVVGCSQVKQAEHAPSDAQITQALTTVNNGEITLAKHVLSQTKNRDVRAFAEHMVQDHTKNNHELKFVAAKMKIDPADSHKNQTLMKDAEMNQEMLMKLTGKSLDKAYMDDQVKGHEKVLEELKSNLIPAAKNSELKDCLLATLKKVEKHLSSAKEVQAKLI